MAKTGGSPHSCVCTQSCTYIAEVWCTTLQAWLSLFPDWEILEGRNYVWKLRSQGHVALGLNPNSATY